MMTVHDPGIFLAALAVVAYLAFVIAWGYQMVMDEIAENNEE